MFPQHVCFFFFLNLGGGGLSSFKNVHEYFDCIVCLCITCMPVAAACGSFVYAEGICLCKYVI